MAEEELTATALIHRDMGRLEGRMAALESRVARNEETVERGFSLLSDKLDGIEGQLEAISLRNAAADGKQRGSKSAYAVIGSAILAGISFIGTAAMAIGSFVHK